MGFAKIISDYADDFSRVDIYGEEESVKVHSIGVSYGYNIMEIRAGERVVIPFFMSEGGIIGIGKGNPAWNYSAPHGAGWKLTRSQAKGLSLDEYRKRTRGIWSSTVNKKTLDESPMVYKRSRDVLDFIEDTVTITHRLKPLYNFKPDNA